MSIINRIKGIRNLDKKRYEEFEAAFSYFEYFEKDLVNLFRNIFTDKNEKYKFINFLVNLKKENRKISKLLKVFGKTDRKVFVISGLEGTGKTLLIDLCFEALFNLNDSPLKNQENKRRDTLKNLNIIVVDEVNDLDKLKHIISYNPDANIIILTNLICSPNFFNDPDTTIITTNFNRIHGEIDRKNLLISFKEFFNMIY